MRSLLCLVLLTGCGTCGSTEETPPVEPEANESTDNSESAETSTPSTVSVGTVRGVVRLVEGAELPEYTHEQAQGPRHSIPMSDTCAPPRQVDRTPVRMDESRALQNVLISATGDPQAFFAALPPLEPMEHAISIEDCRLTPAVLGVARGDTVVVTNNSDDGLLPTLGDSAFMQAIARGMSASFEIERGGPQTMFCGFAAPCGRADIIALAHRVHTTTGEGGTFEMTNVPAGQPIQIHAWHMLFEDTTVETQVEEGGVAEVVIELRPANRPAPAPEPEEIPEGSVH